MNSKAEFDPKTYAIIGAAMEVHRELKWGYAEPVYQECMEIELRRRSIPFLAQEKLHLRYKGQLLKSWFKPDFLCFDCDCRAKSDRANWACGSRSSY